MENNNWSFNQVSQAQTSNPPAVKTFMSSVFSWMGIALAISAVTAYVFGTDPSYLSYLVHPDGHGLTTLGYVIMFAPIGFVLLMSFGFQRLSSTALSALFLVYSVIMGMSLSFIFMIYSQSSIYQVFLVSAVMFGGMGLVGYTTKTDLTKLGSLLFMALIGIILAGLVNLFLHSDTMSYIISFVSVIVFTGLTAYDVQKLKQIGSTAEYGAESTTKIAILGALTLYLDFINLFVSLLRLFGGRRD